jgi:hypothetical protein
VAGGRNDDWFGLLAKLVWVLYILAAWVPLQAVVQIADKLSGKTTTVSITVTVTVTIALALGEAAGLVAAYGRIRHQRRELLRLRERCARLEGRLQGREERGLGGGESDEGSS